MVEIYNIDIASHERFARDQANLKAFTDQFHIPVQSARFIDSQTKILDFVPKQLEIDLLMQSYQHSNWAFFAMPVNYHIQRFFSSYIAPSLGSPEKQEADIKRIASYLNQKTKDRYEKERVNRKEKRQKRKDKKETVKDEEEELCEEGDALVELLEKGIKETNLMVDFVFSRIHQFLQA